MDWNRKLESVENFSFMQINDFNNFVNKSDSYVWKGD